MGRKGKATYQGGIINVWKPAGLSSTQTSSKIKRITNNNKAGHVGTLDPFADGVLPVALGRSTNIIRYMDDFTKTYRVLIHFGQNTHTQDLSGEVVASNWPSQEDLDLFTTNPDVLTERLEEAKSKLVGEVTQAVPKYSALKQDGKPLYWYARQGIEVPVKTREIQVYSANLIAAGVNDDIDNSQLLTEESLRANCPNEQKAILEHFPNWQRVDSNLDEPAEVGLPSLWAIFDVKVSSGTYIRTWAEDLGNLLGYGAYAFRLRRLENGPYSLGSAFTVGEVEAAVQAGENFTDYREESGILLSPADAIEEFSVLSLNPTEAKRFIQGQKLNISYYNKTYNDEVMLKLYYQDLFLGIGRILMKNGNEILHPERMFTTVEYFDTRFTRN